MFAAIIQKRRYNWFNYLITILDLAKYKYLLETEGLSLLKKINKSHYNKKLLAFISYRVVISSMFASTF